LRLGCGARTRAPAASETIDVGFERRDVGASWIERAAAPSERFVVFLVVGIGEDFQQSFVTWRAAAVFRRAAANSFEEEQTWLALDHRHDLFELDGVRPRSFRSWRYRDSEGRWIERRRDNVRAAVEFHVNCPSASVSVSESIKRGALLLKLCYGIGGVGAGEVAIGAIKALSAKRFRLRFWRFAPPARSGASGRRSHAFPPRSTTASVG